MRLRRRVSVASVAERSPRAQIDKSRSRRAGLSGNLTLSSPGDFLEFLKTITFSRSCPIPVKFEACWWVPEYATDHARIVCVDIVAKTRDRETNKKIDVVNKVLFTTLPESSEQAFWRIYGEIKILYLHELAESLLLEQRRVLDPHANESPIHAPSDAPRNPITKRNR